jgi:hypothetical protein
MEKTLKYSQLFINDKTMNIKKEIYKPYLSIVTACRNDNYSGDVSKKLILSLSILVNQLKKYNLDAEIIVVEWNPPKNRPKLSSELSILKTEKKIKIRVIEVDNFIHDKYILNNKIKFPAVIATNVGIRRSHGKFIVSKSADTIFSNELIKFIANKNLSSDSVYRADRIDVSIKEEYIKDDWQTYFDSNIVHRRRYNNIGPYVKACGDFMLMSKHSWYKIRGYPEPKNGIGNGEDGEALFAAIGIGLKQICLSGKLVIYKNKHNKQFSDRIKIDQKNILNIFFKVSDKFGKVLEFLRLKTLIDFFVKFLLGILNLPKTKMFDVEVRSVYRYYLVSRLRLKFGGINFIRDKNWGLNLKKLKEIIIF